MIAKILAKGAAADIVGYVMREFHDKEQFTPDTWRVIDSDGILGNDYRRIVDSFDIGTSLNKRISKPIGHIAVSFDKADLPRLTDEFMVQLAKELKESGTETVIIAGYRDGQLFLKEDLEKYARLLIATEDGSAGTKGNVLTVMEEKNEEADVIMACGPMPMLRAIKAYAGDKKIKAYLSLEERMACGVGACLGCVCKTTRKDGHSHVNNTRICTEGPVFEAGEVDI